jgi:hypothetical protein
MKQLTSGKRPVAPITIRTVLIQKVTAVQRPLMGPANVFDSRAAR